MMFSASIRAVEVSFPESVLTNARIAAEAPAWTADKIFEKTGIRSRRIAREDEFASDFAIAAAKQLFDRHHIDPKAIDFVLYCTQSPDYLLPTAACVLQHRLQIPHESGALDINLGCSGFVYGLGLAQGLIASGQRERVLLLCADTYSKYLRPDDYSTRTIFGDAGSATLIERSLVATPEPPDLGPFVYGSDGRGKENLIVRPGGFRGDAEHAPSDRGVTLKMNGPEIYAFTLQAVPKVVEQLLAAANLRMEDVDFWIFHQASQMVLDSLRRKLKIPAEHFATYLADYGNTVSCSIPLALNLASREGRIANGARVALIGFGVGYSWAACLMRFGDTTA